ncbi:MAG TPA: single-stranded-DNA-specific exonuclease RecJ [Candidatus Paceibacterota bacterium]|nr:single-stranded-DNA-specific exonuclease RecJ [Candidatus Paceibacterota bacterium]
MEHWELAGQMTKGEKKVFSEYPELVAELLFRRGIKTKEEAEKFLHPDWDRDVRDPFGILGMKKAVERIFRAIGTEERILIYGDYDCDGIPGSVVLHDFFTKIGYRNFANYIPHRHDEGYGFHVHAVEQAKEKNVALIITVDVGITDYAAVSKANELGIDVIITDHHLPIEENGKQKIPKAYAVLNSKQWDDTYHDDMLCGAGVAFKLVQALLQKGKANGRFSDIPDGWEKWLLDMAGLSTVADMVPLQKENRALAYFGLQVMRKSRRKGLMALLQRLGIDQKNITEDDIGFMIAPRINAASRIDHPLRAFELLTAAEDIDALRLARLLDGINDRRKGLVAAMMKEAKKKLAERELHEVIVLGNPDWHPGLIGLAANKIMEDFSRPVFIWGRDATGVIKGSCRSDGTVSVVELMTSARAETFLQFGGHDGAGGFSVSHESVHTLEIELSSVYQKMERKEQTKSIQVDKKLTLDQVNWETYEQIALFAPFGQANPKPQFLFENISILAVRKFGKAKEHLELIFRGEDGKRISAIMFFAPEEISDRAEKGKAVDLIATFEKSTYRKTPELRLRIVEVFDRA